MMSLPYPATCFDFQNEDHVQETKYVVSERKPGFFVQIKEDDPTDGGINLRNTLSISRINPPQAG